jgi:superfamily II RNA helicase
MERQFAPVIIFSFSKKDCEIYAMQMAKLDFNTGLYISVQVLMLLNVAIIAYRV